MRHDQSIIDRETDARFWAQTGYKPGQRLDMAIAQDLAMVPVWLDTFAKVRAEDEAGRLVVTYNHPEVERGIRDAKLAHEATAAHLGEAATRDERGRHFHAEEAAAASAAAESAARRASRVQPATVSPELAHDAAARATAGTGVSPGSRPDVAGQRPAAAPILPPGVGTPPPPVYPIQSCHVSAARAAAAPAVAAAAHAREAEQERAGTPRPAGTIAHADLGRVRAAATNIAERVVAEVAGGDGVVVVLDPTVAWSTHVTLTPGEARSWYDEVAARPELYRYMSFHDRRSPTWPRPVVDVLGSSVAMSVPPRAQVPPVTAEPPPPPSPSPPAMFPGPIAPGAGVPGAPASPTTGMPRSKKVLAIGLSVGLGFLGVLGISKLAARADRGEP